MNYAVIDMVGNIVNRIVLVGQSSWVPPSGFSVVLETAPMDIGGTYINGVYTPLPSAPPRPPSAEEVREQSFVADTERQDLVSRIVGATPDQLRNYVNNNVTDLASAKVLLRKVILVMATLVQK